MDSQNAWNNFSECGLANFDALPIRASYEKQTDLLCNEKFQENVDISSG